MARTPSPENVKVSLSIFLPVSERMASALAKAMEPEVKKEGKLEVTHDGLFITAEGMSIQSARAALNSHLRVLKAAFDSIRVIDIQ
ncbi:MAG: hypothetical protein JRN68_00450 [Nitrososphaerota archaeon]|nr:hypothetical protein [Nitrososphaerota archaeon]